MAAVVPITLLIRAAVAVVADMRDRPLRLHPAPCCLLRLEMEVEKEYLAAYPQLMADLLPMAELPEVILQADLEEQLLVEISI